MIQTWPFAPGEKPEECHSLDELHCTLGEHTLIVYRNGEVSTRFANGEYWAWEELRDQAAAAGKYKHPNGKLTTKTKRVETDAHGNFVRWAPD
jgi:hypothetical protein